MKIPDPQTFTDPEKLRKLMANAVRLGYEDLAFQCRLRIAELAGAAHEDVLERAFWTALSTAEEIKTAENGKTTRLAKTRQKHKRVGAQKILEEWALDPATTDGFATLVAHDRSDLTGEAIVLRHEDRFSIDAVNAARKKLMDHGVAIAATTA